MKTEAIIQAAVRVVLETRATVKADDPDGKVYLAACEYLEAVFKAAPRIFTKTRPA